jgi:DNA-binding transcriptional MerR regulator
MGGWKLAPVAGSLTIGDFARATHLSVKMLRHYHELGLLVPAEVDARSGYRRYSAAQIAIARVIRRFRELDMPLDEIRAVVGAPPDARAAVIAGHLERCERELEATQAAVVSLRALLAKPEPSAIVHRSEPPLPVAAITGEVALGDLSAWFQGALGEIQATLSAQQIAPAGPSGAVVSEGFFADDGGELIVFVPAAGVRQVGRITTRVLPAVELAVVVHEGAHADIDRSYGALAKHVTENAIAIEGPIRERYLMSRIDTPDTSRWRTEIGWPIFRILA